MKIGVLKLYNLYDVVEDKYLTSTLTKNDSACVRNFFPNWVNVYPLKDLKITCVGELDTNTNKLLAYDDPIEVSWDSYKYPDSKMESDMDVVGLTDEEKEQMRIANNK